MCMLLVSIVITCSESCTCKRCDIHTDVRLSNYTQFHCSLVSYQHCSLSLFSVWGKWWIRTQWKQELRSKINTSKQGHKITDIRIPINPWAETQSKDRHPIRQYVHKNLPGKTRKRRSDMNGVTGATKPLQHKTKSRWTHQQSING